MGGFFRKVAGAFVYLDDEAEDAKPAPDAGELEGMSRDANELIRQLGGTHEPTPAAAPQDAPADAAHAAPQISAMDMLADQVFAAAGIADGPNSAQRVLKIIAGLAMFPREQQVVMVRAMDSADEGWSEREVLDDARRRQSALRSHVQTIEAEKTQRLQSVAQRIEQTQARGQRRLDDIDQQIAELQKLRQEAVAVTTTALAELEQERRQTEEVSERARRGITAVVNALSELITFFTGGEARPVGKS